MIDLNKIPDVQEEVPISKEVNQEVVETHITERSHVLNGTTAYRMGGEDVPLMCLWQTLSPSELASLYDMVQVPVNYRRVHHVITHRAKGTSEHAWISWLPARHASLGGTVVQSSEWRSMPSIFHAAPAPLSTQLISRGPTGRGAPDVSSAFFDPRRPWALVGGQVQVPPQAITNTTDKMESCQAEINDDRVESAIDNWNNMRTKNSMMERRTAVRLEKLRPESEDGTHVRILMGVRTPLESAQDQQGIESLSKKGAENPDEPGISSDSAYVGAELLGHLAREEKRKMREAAFLAEFNFSTQRCTAIAPCNTCLEFCKTPMSADLAGTIGSCLGAWYFEDEHPPMLRNMDEEEVNQKKGARHGPKSKSSEYRGVTFYKRTGRWESHIWHEAAQIYLGASATKELAAKAYDKAAILLGGPNVDINFEPESYQNEMRYLYKLSKEQLVIYLRRDSRGFSAQAAYPGVKHVKNHYQAICGETLLGTYQTEEEAARIVYRTAIQDSLGTMANLIINTHHVRNMPSFAAEQYAALYPEEVKVMMMNKQNDASKKESKSSIPPKKLTFSAEQKSSFEFARAVLHSIASPKPVKELPAIQERPNSNNLLDDLKIDKNGHPAAKRSRSTWGQHLASRRANKKTCATEAVAAHYPPKTSVVSPSSLSRRPCSLTSPGVTITPVSPSMATILSAFSGIGQTSTPSSVPACSVPSSTLTSETITAPSGFIKFKLFNTEITVAEEETAAEHGGQGNAN